MGELHDDHFRAGSHLLGRVAEQVDDGRRARQQSARWLGHHGRNPAHARNRNGYRVRIDGRQGFHVGRNVPDLVRVVRFRDASDFGQTEVRSGVNHARVDVQPRAVDDAGAVRNGNVLSNGNDAITFNDNRAALDGAVGYRFDTGIGDGIGALSGFLVLLLGLRLERLDEEADRQDECHKQFHGVLSWLSEYGSRRQTGRSAACQLPRHARGSGHAPLSVLRTCRLQPSGRHPRACHRHRSPDRTP